MVLILCLYFSLANRFLLRVLKLSLAPFLISCSISAPYILMHYYFLSQEFCSTSEYNPIYPLTPWYCFHHAASQTQDLVGTKQPSCAASILDQTILSTSHCLLESCLSFLQISTLNEGLLLEQNFPLPPRSRLRKSMQ